MADRLIHDEAFVLAKLALSLVAHLLGEEEHKELFGKFYELARTAIERFVEAEERKRKRLRPSAKSE